MRIESYQKINKLYTSEKTSGVKQNTVTSKNDKLEISQTALDYQIAKKAVSEVEDVRDELISKVKNKINSDGYSVSADDFANKVIDSYNKLKF